MDLSLNSISKIDLRPLVDCKKLKQLDLSKNSLREIILAPIKNLRSLDIPHNHLREIDLSPLKKCKKLTHLDLEDNEFRNIILVPIESLESINICSNPLKKIDLSPLAPCKNLEIYAECDIEIVGAKIKSTERKVILVREDDWLEEIEYCVYTVYWEEKTNKQPHTQKRKTKP